MQISNQNTCFKCSTQNKKVLGQRSMAITKDTFGLTYHYLKGKSRKIQNELFKIINM